MNKLLPFIRLLGRHSHGLLLGLLLTLITALAGISLLALSGWLISAAAFAGLSVSTAVVFNYLLPAAGIRTFAMIRIAGRYGERVINHDGTLKLLATLRVWFYRQLEPLAPAFLVQHRSGDLLNRIITDIDALDNLYLRILAPTLIALIISILTFAGLYLFDHLIATLVFSLLLVSIIIVPLLAMRLGAQPSQSLTRQAAKLRTQIVATIQGLAEQLIVGNHQHQIQAIENTHDTLINNQRRMSHIKGLTQAAVSLLTGIALWLALFIGIKLVYDGQLNGANLALITFTIIAVFEVILPLPLAFQYLGKTCSAAERLLAISNTTPCIRFINNAIVPLSNYTIQFHDVCFSYQPNTQPILDHINLTINQGEHIAIMGETGVGKSSLIHLLARFWDPNSGSITIGNIDIRDLSEAQLRSTMTVVNQRPHIFNGAIKDNLLLACPHANDADLQHALAVAQLDTVIDALPDGLNTWLGETGIHLSGGQNRRLAIARAILHAAPIVMLDEPTEGLDPTTADNMLTALLTHFRDHTVIMISHHRADADKMKRIFSFSSR